MKNKQSVSLLLLIIYILFGIVFLISSRDAFIMYFTCFSFQLFLLVIAMRKRFFTLSFFLILMLLSQGVNPVTYFVSLEKNGTDSVLYGILSYSQVFEGYRYIAFFSILLLLFFILFRRARHGHVIDFITSKGRQYLNSPKKTVSFVLLIVVAVLFCILSLWMYNNQIGLLGLYQKELPFHLTGFFYYFRLYIANIILLWLYFKSRNKSLALFVLSSYAVILGLTSLSRGAICILILPVIAEGIINRRWVRTIASVLIFFALFNLVTIARGVIYELGSAVYSTSQLLGMSITNWFQSGVSFLDFVDDFTARLYGIRDVYLSASYHLCHIRDMLLYYLGVPISVIVPDMAAAVFGKNLARGMAFGVAVGFNGNMIMLANGSYLLVAIQALIVFIVLYLQELLIQKSIIMALNDVVILAILILISLSMLVLWQGLSMLLIYIITCFIFIIYKASASKPSR